MPLLINRRAMIGFVAASFLCVAAGPAHALDVGPKDLPLTVAGVPVQIPVAGSIDVRGDGDAITLEATASGDLHAIQDHALAIARGLRLPRDPCAHKNVNVIIKSLDAASITPRGDSAIVDLSGHVGVWLCGKVLGQTVKTELASDSLDISVPIELYVRDPQTIGLRLSGPATLKTGDPATADAVKPFANDLNELLTAQLARLLETSRARAGAPSMPGVTVTIEDAAFAQDGTKLSVRAHGRATMNSTAFASFLGFFGQ